MGPRASAVPCARVPINLRAARNSARHRALMQTDEYLKLAEVEDQMWYFRSLHAHVGRELSAVLTRGSRAHLASSGKTTRPSLAGQETGVRHMAAGEQGSRSTPAVLDA